MGWGRGGEDPYCKAGKICKGKEGLVGGLVGGVVGGLVGGLVGALALLLVGALELVGRVSC